MQVEGDAFILHIYSGILTLLTCSLIASERDYCLISGRPLGELIDSTLSLFNEEEKSKREVSMEVLRGAGTSQTRAN